MCLWKRNNAGRLCSCVGECLCLFVGSVHAGLGQALCWNGVLQNKKMHKVRKQGDKGNRGTQELNVIIELL